MAYVLDADVLIRANRDHYSLEMAPGFWDWLIQANGDGRLYSIRQVRDELTVGDDDLAQWAGHDGIQLFEELDQNTLASVAQISAWAQTADYRQAAVAAFLGSTDLFLIAQAHAHDEIVVTHETPAPDAQRRIKIPDVCDEFGVACIDPFTMLRREGLRLVMG